MINVYILSIDIGQYDYAVSVTVGVYLSRVKAEQRGIEILHRIKVREQSRDIYRDLPQGEERNHAIDHHSEMFKDIEKYDDGFGCDKSTYRVEEFSVL